MLVVAPFAAVAFTLVIASLFVAWAGAPPLARWTFSGEVEVVGAVFSGADVTKSFGPGSRRLWCDLRLFLEGLRYLLFGLAAAIPARSYAPRCIIRRS